MVPARSATHAGSHSAIAARDNLARAACTLPDGRYGHAVRISIIEVLADSGMPR
jgi:hypothetical protein